MTTEAVIIDAVRSPVGRGKPGGALSNLHAVDLLAQVFAGLFARNDVDPAQVDDVIVGCVSQAADQAGTPGRWAWLSAGLPEHVPAVTIDRRCGSSQQSIHFGAQGIIAGAYDVVVVGGVESMSRVPMGSARMGVDPYGPGAQRRYAPGLIPQGVSAELVAAKWGLTRDDLDTLAESSQRRAAEAAAAGLFDDEIIDIHLPNEDGDAVVGVDETIRPGTTREKLAGLSAAFRTGEMSARFPEITWVTTAGNSSQLADGASALLIMSDARAETLGLRPMARVHTMALASDDPIMMLTGPIPATQRALAKSGLGLDEIDHYEVNEAFASVPLAWRAEFGADDARLNPLGGAIALGHPLGASGARLMTTMLHALRRGGGRYGLQAMCEAGGMANATVVEML